MVDFVSDYFCVACGTLFQGSTIQVQGQVEACPGSCLIVVATTKARFLVRSGAASSSRPQNPSGGAVGPGQGREAPPEGVQP